MGKATALGFLLIIIAISMGAYLLYTPPKPSVAISRIYDVTEPGKIIEVNVTVNDVRDLYQWVFIIRWDPTLLRIATGDKENGYERLEAYRYDGIQLRKVYYNIYEGPFLKNVGATLGLGTTQEGINNEKGILGIGNQLGAQASASGSGVVLIIQFEVIRVGTTTIEIDPEKSVLADTKLKAMDFNIVNGLVTDQSYTPPPIWESRTFQVGTVLTEIIVLAVISMVVIKISSPPVEKGEEEKEIEKALEEIGELE